MKYDVSKQNADFFKGMKLISFKFESLKLSQDLKTHNMKLYLFISQDPKDLKNVNNIASLIFSDLLTLNFDLLFIYIDDPKVSNIPYQYHPRPITP